MKFLKLALLGCLFSTAMFATSILACTEQTLAAYLASSSNCSIGNLVFGSFSYQGTALGTGVALTPDQITVIPINTAGNVGIEFAANWVGSQVGGSDSAVGYFVATGSGAATITAASLGMDATAAGDANAVLDEYICPGEVFSSTCANQIHLHDLEGPAGPSSPGPIVLSSTFDPVSYLQLVKDIRVYGVAGTSTVSDISNEYTAGLATPEPVTPVLCLSGLLLAWVLQKRRSA